MGHTAAAAPLNTTIGHGARVQPPQPQQQQQAVSGLESGVQGMNLGVAR